MSRISKKLLRMAAYIIVLLSGTILTVSFLSFQSVTDETIEAKCQTTVNVLRNDIERSEQETATVAEGLSTNELFLQCVAEGDINGVASNFEAVPRSEGIFAAVSDMTGNVIWKSDNAVDKLDFSAGLAGQTLTDLYADSTTMYYETTYPVEYGGVQVGSLIVGYDLSNTALVDNIK